MGGLGHGSWSNEYSQGPHVDTTGPYSALNYPHSQDLVRYAGNVGHDGVTHLTIGHTEHHGDQTHHGSHHMPVVSSPQLGYYPPAAPPQDLSNDDPLGLMDNVADPSQGNPGPVRSRMWDDEDEDFKRLASQYLNNPDSYVNHIRVRRRRSGGRKILISLEIDDEM